MLGPDEYINKYVKAKQFNSESYVVGKLYKDSFFEGDYRVGGLTINKESLEIPTKEEIEFATGYSEWLRKRK